jgi:transcription elongation factor Elf1
MHHETSEIFFTCPYCGEEISILVDPSVPHQTYIEDCEVCCRPIEITATLHSAEEVAVRAERID